MPSKENTIDSAKGCMRPQGRSGRARNNGGPPPPPPGDSVTPPPRYSSGSNIVVVSSVGVAGPQLHSPGSASTVNQPTPIGHRKSVKHNHPVPPLPPHAATSVLRHATLAPPTNFDLYIPGLILASFLILFLALLLVLVFLVSNFLL